MKSIPISLACFLALTGCQVVPDQLPQAEPAPAASCYFPSANERALEASVDVLTEEGFTLNSTDTALGLISASRERPLHGYYDPYDNAYGYGRGMRLFGGLGIGSGGSGIGFGVGGIGFGGGVGQQPVEVERVSLLVHDAHIRISRDIRRFDYVGDLRESYSASNDDFCRRFQASFEQRVPATGRTL